MLHRAALVFCSSIHHQIRRSLPRRSTGSASLQSFHLGQSRTLSSRIQKPIRTPLPVCNTVQQPRWAYGSASMAPYSRSSFLLQVLSHRRHYIPHCFLPFIRYVHKSERFHSGIPMGDRSRHSHSRGENVSYNVSHKFAYALRPTIVHTFTLVYIHRPQGYCTTSHPRLVHMQKP